MTQLRTDQMEHLALVIDCHVRSLGGLMHDM
jgi:hypothetical protein